MVDGTDPVTGERLVVRTGPEKQLVVPSSRRPDPPDVLYVVPTFTWAEETKLGVNLGIRPAAAPSPVAGPGILAPFPVFSRMRYGGGLRVYLNRPWFSSGDDELLGVVLADQPFISWPIDVLAGIEVPTDVRLAADAVAQRILDRGAVTAAGSPSLSASERLIQSLGGARGTGPEALQAGAAQLGPLTSVIGGFMGQMSPGIDPDKLVTHWGSDPIWGSSLPDSGPFIYQFPLRVAAATGRSLAETSAATVTVVGHRPQFDPVRKLWYCDVQVDAGTSYVPFVRLALCRFQPSSIEGAHISRVVRADFAQLVADRTATLQVRGGSATVAVRGPVGYTEVGARFSPISSVSTDKIDASRIVLAQLEQLGPAAEPTLGWQPAGPDVQLTASVAGGLSDVHWSGSVPLPPGPAGWSRRIAVRELELLECDDSVKDATIVERAGSEFPVNHPVRYRLVYADHLAL